MGADQKAMNETLCHVFKRLHYQGIRKGQLGDIKGQASSAANQFYSLAF
ncbi:hypothetical protein Rahaq_5057 (plasmid) [Rahnella aceris]|jgi:hypothetical protein|uniref:Uncharacterized protein n=1 Tax=Rahnella sp. (strain Y9602) TaxID=2703885 RepID=A0A0H3FJY7_RAHSY|nr:hypothetical protein [Rahnella aceris]ADW76631.1 hypothetical protein Rahaq_5057 [Rahnella aceris]